MRFTLRSGSPGHSCSSRSTRNLTSLTVQVPHSVQTSARADHSHFVVVQLSPQASSMINQPHQAVLLIFQPLPQHHSFLPQPQEFFHLLLSIASTYHSLWIHATSQVHRKNPTSSSTHLPSSMTSSQYQSVARVRFLGREAANPFPKGHSPSMQAFSSVFQEIHLFHSMQVLQLLLVRVFLLECLELTF